MSRKVKQLKLQRVKKLSRQLDEIQTMPQFTIACKVCLSIKTESDSDTLDSYKYI